MDYAKRGQFPWRSLQYRASTRPLGLRLGHYRPSQRIRLAIFIFNSIIVIFLAILLNSVYNGLVHSSYTSPPPHYKYLTNAIKASNEPGRGNVNNEKIFIASNIINAELINGPWSKSLGQLINYLGPDNVFVSIYENNSGEETSIALGAVAKFIPCEHSIVYGDDLPLSKFPAVLLRNGEARVKRLTYLEEVRNRLLWPLQDPIFHPGLNKTNFTNTPFDKILFINDVFFDPIEVVHLLFSTHYSPQKNRADYNAACAIDFFHPIQHYDEFVVRDSEGYIPGVPFYPWFNNQGSAESRKAVLAESDAVPVKSCWGGIVAFAADEFLRRNVLCLNKDDPNLVERCNNLSPIHATQGPLRFRHQSETYWEAPECCLLHADLAYRKSQQTNPESDPKIYMNPYVRTTYSAKSWSWHRFGQRFEKFFTNFNYFASWIFYKDPNPRRTQVPFSPAREMQWRFHNDALNGEAKKRNPMDRHRSNKELAGHWTVVDVPEAQPGGFCGQRLSLVMKGNLDEANRKGRNWEKIQIPEGEPRS